MKKRILSLVLAVMLVVSVATVYSASAAENAQEVSADNGTIYFSIPQPWMDFTDENVAHGIVPGSKKTQVFCYVFQIGNLDPDWDKNPGWQTKSTKCTYNAETGMYEYPIATKLSLKDYADYGVIFSARDTDTLYNPQTYDLTIGPDCYGDTVYTTNTIYENPQDSKKKCYAAYWTKPENAEKYGPHAGITSLGVLQGEVYAPHEDKYLAIANFIHDFSQNATPEKCAALCEQIGVEPYDVYTTYATAFAEELEAGAEIASLETVAGLLSLDYPPVPPTTEAPTTEPVTTEPPTTEAPTTEPPTTEPPTTEPPTTEPPTTVAPTTVEPTTVAPTTVEPTTVEPTTVAPTTEPATTEPPAKKWTVAGDEALTGVMWNPAENPMTAGSYEFDGKTYDYSITFNDIAAGSYGFKVTNGTWDEAYPAGNYTFSTDDTGYVTIYFNSDTKEIAVDAEHEYTWKLESIIVVGNGDGGAWLNGSYWDLDDPSNLMTEVEPGIWSITYENVEAYDSYEYKYACNHSWQPYNWTSDGVLDGQTNPPMVVEQDGSTVTITLDVTGFDFTTGEGTVVPGFIVTPPVVPTTEPATTEPVTTEPVTTEPVTTEPVTTEPVTTEPVTTEPVTTEPVTTEPVTTEPVTTEPVTTEPVTTEPVTTEPVTTVPVEPTTTVAPQASTSATQAPSATSSVASADTPTSATTSSNGTVKTSDSSLAVMLLVLLVAATGIVIVLRKREYDK